MEKVLTRVYRVLIGKAFENGEVHKGWFKVAEAVHEVYYKIWGGC